VVIDLLTGMSRETQLVWNHAFYWGLIVRAGDAPATSEMVIVLAQTFAMTGANAYALANVRRLFRRIYERGEHAAMSDEAQRVIAASGVAWKLEPLRSLGEAWDVMVTLAVSESYAGGAAASCPNVWEHCEGGRALAGDLLLAEFIAANPRVLEREVIARAAELSKMPGSVGKPVLSHVLETGFEQPSAWQRTHAAWDAELGLQLFEKAQREQLLDHTTVHNSFHVATGWCRRAPDRITGLSPEMRDVLRALDARTGLPVILSEDVLEPAQIEHVLADYSGITIEQLYERFHRGFIGPDERLGALIARDAATLRTLGVSRMVLADRLQETIAAVPFDHAWHAVGDLQVTAMAFMGHKHDPFHIYDVYDLIGHLGAKDFTIRRGELELRGGDLQVALIRRACFFGGAGGYRLEPEIAARVLGLVGSANG
jgi:hypothetical protein